MARKREIPTDALRPARPRERKSKSKPKPKSALLQGFPQSARDLKFCERWLQHFDPVRAYLEAGWAPNDKIGVKMGSNTGHRARQKLESLAAYLEPLRLEKARAVAERLTLDQADVLDAMARVAKVNPLEYVEQSSEPMTRTVPGPEGEPDRDLPVLWDGKPVYRTRLRPLHELTREQAAVVQLVSVPAGVGYRLPSIKERHESLIALGRQLGMFIEKLIVENHQHQHRHAHLHLDNVSSEKIREIGRQLIPLVGREFAAELGYGEEEFLENRESESTE